MHTELMAESGDLIKISSASPDILLPPLIGSVIKVRKKKERENILHLQFQGLISKELRGAIPRIKHLYARGRDLKVSPVRV